MSKTIEHNLFSVALDGINPYTEYGKERELRVRFPNIKTLNLYLDKYDNRPPKFRYITVCDFFIHDDKISDYVRDIKGLNDRLAHYRVNGVRLTKFKRLVADEAYVLLKELVKFATLQEIDRILDRTTFEHRS